MEKIFVDTSGWVALFVANDVNHRSALAIFDNLKKGKSLIHTSDYIIDETITTILVRGNHKQSVLAGEALLSSKIIKTMPVTADHFTAAWVQYSKHSDKKYSFTDVTSFVLMRALGIQKAFSFDREFQQAGFTLLD